MRFTESTDGPQNGETVRQWKARRLRNRKRKARRDSRSTVLRWSQAKGRKVEEVA